jgi:hypothetical protein
VRGGRAPNSLIVNALGQKKKLDISLVVVYDVCMMKIKIRKTMIFTKARPHKLKNKLLERKQKHKKKLDNES